MFAAGDLKREDRKKIFVLKRYVRFWPVESSAKASAKFKAGWWDSWGNL